MIPAPKLRLQCGAAPSAAISTEYMQSTFHWGAVASCKQWDVGRGSGQYQRSISGHIYAREDHFDSLHSIHPLHGQPCIMSLHTTFRAHHGSAWLNSNSVVQLQLTMVESNSVMSIMPLSLSPLPTSQFSPNPQASHQPPPTLFLHLSKLSQGPQGRSR